LKAGSKDGRREKILREEGGEVSLAGSREEGCAREEGEEESKGWQ
jgi:hypothetical protein